MCIKAQAVRRTDITVNSNGQSEGPFGEILDHHKTFSDKKGLFIW